MSRHLPHLHRRHRGHRGHTIPTHRSLHALEFDPVRQAASVLVALLLGALWILLLPRVAEFWALLSGFTLEVLGVPARVETVVQGRWWIFEIVVPRLGVSAGIPGPSAWSVGLAVTAAMLFVSIVLPRRWLPAAYGLRLLSFVQISSQIVFALTPTAFPYDVPGYSEVLFVAGAFLIGLVPIVLALTYSPMDFHLRHQVGLVLLVVAHLTLFVPLQYTAHAWLMHLGSLLWMPLFFWAFGLTLDVAVIVALYGWGVSWGARDWQPGRRSHPRRRELGFTVLIIGAFVTSAATSRAEDAVPRWTASAGVEIGHYTDDLGESDSQNLALERARGEVDRWRFDLGRARRFGDEGLGVGVGYFRHLGGRTIVSAGLSTGTGDVIFPRWRFDAGLRRTGLDDGRLLIDLGYTHVQSKAENSSDGVGAGLFWYATGPWALGLDGRVDIGQPGSTVGHNVGATLMWISYRQLYLSLRGETGRVAYTLVGPRDALVEYDSRGARAGATWYLRPDRGLGLEASVVDTEFYTLRSLSLRAFVQW